MAATEKNKNLRRDPVASWLQYNDPVFPNEGGFAAHDVATADSIYEHMIVARDVLHPLMRQACAQALGVSAF